MIKISEVAFFSYSVTDIVRAQAFYEDVLGLKKTADYENKGRHWLEYDLGSATLALTNMIPAWRPSPDGGVIAFEVENMETAVAHLKAAGVKFLTEVQKHPACSTVAITDPDGNAITLHKHA